MQILSFGRLPQLLISNFPNFEIGLANGAIQAYDMSKECIITKLMWALYRSKSLSEVQQILHTNYTGEINVEGKLYGARR